MADELRQKMTFDVADAIANIGSLQKQISGLSRSLGTLAKRADAFNQLGSSASQALGGASQSFQQFGTQTQQAAQRMQRAQVEVKNLTVSFETMARVVATQVVVRAMSSLQRAMQSSISDFIEFEKGISEIVTIGSSIGDDAFFTEQARGLSDAFNITLLEATRGTYQALSNQIIQTADDLQVMEEIAFFAAATNSSFESSIDLVSGALNAFSLSTDQANVLSSQFFKTIELGRLRAEELGTAFGRAAPLASQLGVSTAEVNAALATITIGGVRATEASTQLRGIFTAMVKPTVGMREALDKLGVSSAEQLIRLRGLSGALSALVGTTDGSTRAIAALFENVRGLSGTLRLTSSGADTFAKSLSEIENVSADLAKQKGLEVLGKVGQRVSRDFQQIQTALTADLGKRIVEIADAFLSLSGRAEGLIAVGKVLIPLLTVGAGALGGLAVSASLARLRLLALPPAVTELQRGMRPVLIEQYTDQMRNLSRGIIAVGGALAAASLAASIGDNIGNAISGLLLAGVEDARRAAKAQINSEKSLTAEIVGEIQNRADKSARIAEEEIQDLQQLHERNVETVRESSDRIQTILDGALDKVVGIQRQRVNDLRKIATDAANEIERSFARTAEVQKDIRLDKLNVELRNLDEGQQISRLLSEAQQLSRLEVNLTPQQKLAQLQQAVSLAERARGIAESSDDQSATRQLATADEAVLSVKKNILRVEEQIRQAEQRRFVLAQKAKADEEVRLGRVKDIAKELLVLSVPFDKKGEPLSTDEIQQNQKRTSDLLQRLRSEIVNADSIGLDQILGVAQLGSQITNQLDGVEVRTLNFLPSVVGGLAQQIADTEIAVKIRVANAAEEADRFQQEIERAQQASQQRQAADRVQLGIDTLREQADVTGFFTPGFLDDGVRNFVQDLAAAAEQGRLTAGFIAQMEQRFEEMKPDLFPVSIENANTALRISRGILEQNKIAAGETAKSANAFAVNTAANISPSNTVLQVWDGIERATAGSAVNAERFNAAAANVPVGTNPQAQARGGMLYLAGGGATRGTDIIPAMLSPGEFVVNANSSRKFFSELQAINAGVQPTFRGDGGNVTVGDISVTVQGGPTGETTARQIGRELHRELRRQAIKKFK